MLPLETERLILKAPDMEFAPLVFDYFMRNRQHFEPWSPARQPEWDTLQYHEEKIAAYGGATHSGQGLWLLLLAKHDAHRVIGDVHLSNIVRGIFQSCHLGYKVDEHEQGKGYMREALQAVIDYAFNQMKLHRIEANIMPANTRSIQLVKSLGFEEEGLAKKYLKINGHWQDHIHYTLLNGNEDI
jgi:ribosomal-protein-alanine N-acetyltransferase